MHDDKPVIPREGTARHDAVGNAGTLPPARRMASADLFAGAREVEIEHNGRRYLLRITQTGKLILTA